MARFEHRDFSDSAVMIMSPANDAKMAFAGAPVTSECSFASTYRHNSTSWAPVHSATRVYTNPSCKRSRDETFPISNREQPQPLVHQDHAPAPRPEERYGEGMVLLNPRTGMSISAESQTGTWYEEKVQVESSQVTPTEDRPRMPLSRKSVRLDPAVPAPIQLEDVARALAPDSPPKSCTSQPTIDDFTYALGIGWTRLASEDSDVQAAARGWARYLENHYSQHIHGAEILLKSKGLNAYLVGSREGFYLFTEDLLEGRLVGRTWKSCLNNLQTHPIAFEGDQVLRAERAPGLDQHFVNNFSGRLMDENMTGYMDTGISA